jgi:hypothetical protein
MLYVDFRATHFSDHCVLMVKSESPPAERDASGNPPRGGPKALLNLNSKSEARNPKWFDPLTTLSEVEGQIRMIKIQNFKQ